MGTLTEPVPVTGFAANFSPIPRIAPPPLGRLSCGGLKGERSDGAGFSLVVDRVCSTVPRSAPILGPTDSLATTAKVSPARFQARWGRIDASDESAKLRRAADYGRRQEVNRIRYFRPSMTKCI
jgi:hypothetical protein